MKTLRIALAGKPHSGKTTLFNKLTGSHQKVGNYAGVTVDTKEGRLIYRNREIVVYDLPGTYSLTAYSIDEIIARDFVLEEKPDLVIDVLDATNLERNLFLCLQFQELGIPVVGALNIIDQAEAMGLKVGHEQLSRLMGIPIVRTVGSKGLGLNELLDGRIGRNRPSAGTCPSPIWRRYGSRSCAAGRGTGNRLRVCPGLPSPLDRPETPGKRQRRPEEDWNPTGNRTEVEQALTEAVATLERQGGRDSEILVSEARYGFIHGAAREILTRERATVTTTERIDALLINRFLGLPLFLAIPVGNFSGHLLVGGLPPGLAPGGVFLAV